MKLHGFKNPFKIDYEVVNVGDIDRLAAAGAFEGGEMPGAKASKGKAAPVTINQEILRAAGLVRRLDRPMKVRGHGDLSAALFVVADAFSASARSKIEAAGGTVSVLEVPDAPRTALGLDDDHADDAAPAAEASAADAPADAEPAAADATTADAEVAEKPKARKPKAAKTDDAEADA